MVHPILSVIAFGAGAVALAVAILAWQHRSKPAGFPVVVVALSGAVWAVASGLQPMTTDYQQSLVLMSIVYTATDLVAISWLYVTVEYSGRDWFKKQAVGAVIAALALSTMVAMTLNPFDLFYQPGTAVTAEGYFVHDTGPLYWFDIVWKYGLILLGMAILCIEILDRTGVYREQSIAVLSAGVVPSVFAGIEVSGIISIPGFSMGTIGISGSGVILLWSLFYADFLKVPSIAQRTLMQSMDDAVFAVDTETRLLDANQPAMDLFGFDSTAFGKPAASVFIGVPALLDELSARNNSMHVDDGHAVEYTTSTEIQLDKNGSMRYYALKISPITSTNSGISVFQNGQPTSLGILVVVHDVTERVRNEKQLTQANEQLDHFASVVSHDLRNPLSIAHGYLELARERGLDSDFEAIERAHTRMDRMIEDLLKMARTNQGASDLKPTELAAQVTTAWRTARTDGATLSVDLPAETTVQADSDLLQHVFENLFRNAVDHNEPPLTVRVGALEGREGFFIEDDGEGIPESERREIFTHGHTTSKNGSGLGLFIVDEVVTAHGWDITVTDGADGGARFEIETASGDSPQPTNL